MATEPELITGEELADMRRGAWYNENLLRCIAEIERLNKALDGCKRLLGCQQLILDARATPAKEKSND